MSKLWKTIADKTSLKTQRDDEQKQSKTRQQEQQNENVRFLNIDQDPAYWRAGMSNTIIKASKKTIFKQLKMAFVVRGLGWKTG